MNRRRFFSQLLLLTAIVCGTLLLFQIFPVFKAYWKFSFLSLLFFAGLTVAMYLLAIKAAVSKDKNSFTRLVMVFTFVKILVSVTLVIAYAKLVKPVGTFYVLPFFLIYLAYTAFETVFMTKLGKIKAR